MKTVLASEIADFLGARLLGEEMHVSGVSPLNDLRSNTISFANRLGWDGVSEASVLALIPESMQPAGDSRNSFIKVDNPRLSMAKVVQEFFYHPPAPSVAKTAVISGDAQVGEGCTIGEYAVIESGVVVGDGTSVGHHAVIMSGVVVGKDCEIGAHCVLGSDGLSSPRDVDGTPVQIRHMGSLIIGDNVRFGPHTCVQRGTLGETRVGNNVKSSTRINIGHNCVVGDNVLFTSGVCMSGGSRVGENCFLGVNSSIREGVVIGDNVIVGIHSVVIRDVPDGTRVMGLESLDLKSLEAIKNKIGYK